MMLAVVCMIRSGQSYLDGFRTRLDELAAMLPLRVIVGENDSVDNTPELLGYWQRDAAYDVTVINRSEYGEHYPSIDFEPRWRHIAHVMNGVLDLVDEDDDWVMYVDPDLIWEPLMIPRLIQDERDVVAPLAWNRDVTRPYDLWGTRRNGERISQTKPWFLSVQDRGLIEVDSAACLNVMDAHWARTCRFGETDANVGWHNSMRAKGAHIWLNLDEKVIHP